MALSKAKKMEIARAKRVRAIRNGRYPDYPAGVLDHNWECELRDYVQNGTITDFVRRALEPRG